MNPCAPDYFISTRSTFSISAALTTTAVVALCAAITACTTVSGTGRKQLNVYSTSQENAMGAQAYQDEMKNAKIIR
jgi:hypothetical protein